ncbi:DcaP family trimeric outer membrane transporter [Halomonas beimenensis]|uniref:Autotransporter translocation and assembly factor TamB n=1 Tax=Halomonas beimenensis TaxID=475662 RepID=A0A291PAN9_9GAMM|nr:DcaP family trimeric outer membrane transporter [Halomonas beimenensis]ATJ83928.1 autotransporter translocation and assembly factor TamB [Halomonas beimenensis]
MDHSSEARIGRTWALSVGIGSMLALGGPMAWAQMDDATTLQELRAQMQQMQRQIERLEREQREAAARRAAAPDNVVTGGDVPGSFKLPGSDTSVQIGGYVKLDAIYDLDQDLGDTLFVDGLDVADDDGDASFRAHARQSRLYIKTSTPTALGEATTHVEGDFFGGGGNEVFSNSRSFRLRHAYGELAGLLAGQTWSNFMHFAAYPTTVDFDGPVGVSFIRQAQVRYTFPAGPGELSLSAENPEGTGFAGSRDTAPDLTARYAWSRDGAAVETAALVRRLESDDAAASGDDSAIGYGLMLAGNYQVTAATQLMAGVLYGDGIGRYIYTAQGVEDGSDSIGAAFIDGGGDLETIEAYGANAAVVHDWTPKFTSSLSYGRVRGDRPSGLFPTSTRTLQSVHFSHFYQWSDPVVLGFEVSHAYKELQNREDGDNTRLQFSAQYNF